jgi:hypothetical protein
LAREELSKNIGAQPPTLFGRTWSDCRNRRWTGWTALLVVTTAPSSPTITGKSELRSLEILTALGACVRARRWAGRRVWARMWGRRRLRA